MHFHHLASCRIVCIFSVYVYRMIVQTQDPKVIKLTVGLFLVNQRREPTVVLSSASIMSIFGKSKQPRDAPALTPTPPVQLAQDLASRRNSRALAVSSTAIALSIGTAFHDTSETSTDGATVQGRDTGWQAAYGAARMAVEIAKESSDMFPP